MIQAEGISLRRGSKLLLDEASFVVHPGERIGIVGPNGAGKTSLFAVLFGELELDAGTLDMPADWRIARVEQMLGEPDRPAREFVIDGDRQLRALQTQRAQLGEHADGHRIAELETALVEAGAYEADSRAEQLLSGLGFAPTEWQLPVGQFSGGWQMRIALARALMAPSDLLLLDEPTNHLDLDAMLWLERWMTTYPGTILIISHDTAFLESTAQHILHFDHGKLNRYRGGYQAFIEQHAERLRQHQQAYARQQRETDRLQQFVDRFRAQASKARQAQSRIKALARMQTLAPLRYQRGMDIQLPVPDALPDPLLGLSQANIGYPADQEAEEKVVLSNLDLMLRNTDRIGVLGVNGAGKSSLIKTLAGELPLLSGERKPSRGLEIGYFAQHQLDMLDVHASPLQHLARLAPEASEQTLRTYLGSFGFSGDMARQPVEPFSGGEKARLALALIVWRKPNLLLLDEPSNHLDVDTREALADALTTFEGCVLLVSHDRHLLRTTVDRFWIIADNQLTEFDGDLDDYRAWLQQRLVNQRQDHHTQTPTSTGAADRRTQRRHEAQARQELARKRRPLDHEIARLERAIASCSHTLETLEQRMADPTFYADDHQDERVRVLAEHGKLTKTQQLLEEAWLEQQEALEALLNG